jgi:hypothetical protein
MVLVNITISIPSIFKQLLELVVDHLVVPFSILRAKLLLSMPVVPAKRLLAIIYP